MRGRILALAILCALVLQMELPAAHSPAHSGSAGSAIALTGAQPLELQPASATLASAHDPASCPICQSLHAKPAAPPPGLSQRGPSERSLALLAPPQRSHACVALTGHPPRAPPLAALSLA